MHNETIDAQNNIQGPVQPLDGAAKQTIAPSPAAENSLKELDDERQRKKDEAKKRFEEQVAKEKKKTWLAVGAAGAIAIGAAALWPVAFPSKPPKTAQEIQDAKAKYDFEHPDETLAGRPTPTMLPPEKRVPKKLATKPAPIGAPPAMHAPVIPKPAAPPKPKVQVSNQNAPSKEMLAEVAKQHPGKPALSLNGDGTATLPDGRKVKVSVSSPAQRSAEAQQQYELAKKNVEALTPKPIKSAGQKKYEMEAASALSNALQHPPTDAKADKNGVKTPMTLQQALEFQKKAFEQAQKEGQKTSR